MESIVLWTLAVVVPALIIVGYWLLARAQVRRATKKVAGKLDAERAMRRRVSHQVRDSLTVIYGFSEALLDTDLEDSDEVRSVVTTINSEALTVSRTVENLVAATKVESADLDPRSIPFDLPREIERAVTPFQRLGHEIAVDGPALTGLGDPVLFRQIIQNLVANAVRHGGSQISVVSVLTPGAYLCTIADDGDGLPAEVAAQLFPIAKPAISEEDDDSAEEPPTPGPVVEAPPTPSAERGMHMGLPVSLALAEALGGSLDYEHAEGVTMLTLALETKGWPEPPPQAKEEPVDAVADEYAESEEAEQPEPEVVYHDETISFDDEPGQHFESGDLEPAADTESSVEAGTPS